MYRSRNLLVLFRERRKLLTVQRQVVRCSALKCPKFSRRQLSDSVKVLSRREEYDGKDENPSTRKSSPKKLFSLDDILEEEGSVTGDKEKQVAKGDSEPKANKEVLQKEAQDVKKLSTLDDKPEKKGSVTVGIEKQITKDDSEQKANKEVLQEGAQEMELDDAKDQQEVKIEEKPNILTLDQEQCDNAKIEDGKSSKTVEVLDEVEDVEKPELGSRSKHSLKEEIFVRKEITLINSIHDHSKLLDMLDFYFHKNLSVSSKNALIVCVLKNLERLNVFDLGEETVKALQNHLDYKSQITKFITAHLLNILDFFMKGSPEDNDVAFALLHELCWRLRKTPLKPTLMILETVKPRQSTDKRREVYEMGKQRLLEIIGNVSSPQELLMAMYLLTGNKEAQVRLEEEASIMLQSMDSVQTYKLIYLLGLNFSKNKSLVGRASKQLGSRPINLDMIKLKNLFFACGVLRINDQNLLREMSVNMLDFLKNEGHFIDSDISLSVLLSCSVIRWNYKSLTNKIMKKLSEDIDSCLNHPNNKLYSLVTSIGHLNLIEHSDLGLKISEHLVSKGVRQGNLLNMHHSLACIQKADNGSVLELLQPAFYQPLLDSLKDQPAFLQDNFKRKLLNLYGYLKEDHHKTVPDIDSQAKEWRDQLQEKTKSVPLYGLAKVVSEVLTDIAPLEKYTNTNVVTKYGYTIDFEIFVDKKLKAVRLDSSEGMQKVWIKMLDYSGFIQGGQEPEYSGDTAMMLRHLKSEQEAAIVYVPYLDWGQLEKKVDHLLYLEAKIKEAVEPAVETKDSASSDLQQGEELHT
ncbi:uncharacterized protein LOC123561866 [Mercenaria mercenaria]|uniref:uncharacterized protein LOC123561866 n=1 Tax=Mercenaria mercenaria TaxID=6596 RepID=UPI00234EFD3D|nr:uncharacterized protein LOC123561866 [Mercenaria mercenaria]